VYVDEFEKYLYVKCSMGQPLMGAPLHLTNKPILQVEKVQTLSLSFQYNM